MIGNVIDLELFLHRLSIYSLSEKGELRQVTVTGPHIQTSNLSIIIMHFCFVMLQRNVLHLNIKHHGNVQYSTNSLSYLRH